MGAVNSAHQREEAWDSWGAGTGIGPTVTVSNHHRYLLYAQSIYTFYFLTFMLFLKKKKKERPSATNKDTDSGEGGKDKKDE